MPTVGKLVLCPTPLGNLEDITMRVLRALREADIIFAEDTRVTKNLLRHFDIGTRLRSFPEGAREARLRTLRALLEGGKTVAMVSDAGMPGISDPGSELVREARDCGAAIEVLPGPSAVPGALVLSGFEVSSFRFDGFPPRKPGERQAYLSGLEHDRAAVVWFEGPSRVIELLHEVAATLPQRQVFVLREYTKLFEQHIWGTAEAALREIATPPRGEFTIVLEGYQTPRGATEVAPATFAAAEAAIAFLRGRAVSAKDATEAVRLATGLSKNDLYRIALKVKQR